MKVVYAIIFAGCVALASSGCTPMNAAKIKVFLKGPNACEIDNVCQEGSAESAMHILTSGNTVEAKFIGGAKKIGKVSCLIKFDDGHTKIEGADFVRGAEVKKWVALSYDFKGASKSTVTITPGTSVSGEVGFKNLRIEVC